MIATYDDLTPEALAPLGFDDPAQACRLLQGMAGHDVPDMAFDAFLRVMMPALPASARPGPGGRQPGALGGRRRQPGVGLRAAGGLPGRGADAGDGLRRLAVLRRPADPEPGIPGSADQPGASGTGGATRRRSGPT